MKRCLWNRVVVVGIAFGLGVVHCGGADFATSPDASNTADGGTTKDATKGGEGGQDAGSDSGGDASSDGASIACTLSATSFGCPSGQECCQTSGDQCCGILSSSGVSTSCVPKACPSGSERTCIKSGDCLGAPSGATCCTDAMRAPNGLCGTVGDCMESGGLIACERASDCVMGDDCVANTCVKPTPPPVGDATVPPDEDAATPPSDEAGVDGSQPDSGMVSGSEGGPPKDSGKPHDAHTDSPVTTHDAAECVVTCGKAAGLASGACCGDKPNCCGAGTLNDPYSCQHDPCGDGG